MMKIEISSSELLRVVKMAVKLKPTKANINLYGNMRLFKEEDDFFMQMLNESSAVTYKVDLNVTGGTFFGAALPIATFSQILSVLPEQPLEMVFDDSNKVEVSYQNGHFSMPYTDAADFPVPPSFEDGISISLPTGVITGAMKVASLHKAEDTLRPVMGAVATDIHEDYFVVVASDGHTLYRNKCLLSEKLKGSPAIALSNPSVVGLLELAVQNVEEPVKMTSNGRYQRFESDRWVIQSRLIDGRYPNYDSVIPQDNPYSVQINKRLLQSALRRVSLMGNLQQPIVKLSFYEEAVRISAQDIDFSTSAAENVSVERYDVASSEPVEIGFNVDKLNRCLSSLSSEVVELSFRDGSMAVVLKEINGNDNVLALCMPVMLND